MCDTCSNERVDQDWEEWRKRKSVSLGDRIKDDLNLKMFSLVIEQGGGETTAAVPRIPLRAGHRVPVFSIFIKNT